MSRAKASEDTGECLTFGELISLSVYLAPAEYRRPLTKYKSIVTQLDEANDPVIVFSDFLNTFSSVKPKLFKRLSEAEVNLLIENEDYIRNFIFDIYTEHFTYFFSTVTCVYRLIYTTLFVCTETVL